MGIKSGKPTWEQFYKNTFNPVKPNGKNTYHLLYHLATLYFARRVYRLLSYGSQNIKTGSVFFEVRTELINKRII